MQITGVAEKSQDKGGMGGSPCRTPLGGKLLDLQPLLLGLQCLKPQVTKEDLIEAWRKRERGKGRGNSDDTQASDGVTRGDLSKPDVCLP